MFHSLKNKLQCKPNRKEVYDPKKIRHQKGSKRYLTNSSSFYEESEGSIDISDPIINEILYDSSSLSQCNSGIKDWEGSFRTTKRVDSDDGPSILMCYKCGEKLKNLNAVETHHINEHSVTEFEEDSSRHIVKTICESGQSLVCSELWQIDCILKVHNMPKTLACFEEYREIVKIKANKLHNKNHNPRCLVDGNELLMFHGTNIACSLGINNSYSLCNLDYCGVCQILRHGFSTNKEFQGALGVYTTSTSGKAFDSIVLCDERAFTRKSVIVCRVIAGRVHCPFEEIQEKVDSRFDSLAEKLSKHGNIEELNLLNHKALLPCFVVIYKQQTMKIKRFHSSSRISSI
ncbi:zinc finger (C2H2 type) family protein [Trifolium repens]|nr:zinc finger (C2H2 type) family protein [Trifolium repens]